MRRANGGPTSGISSYPSGVKTCEAHHSPWIYQRFAMKKENLFWNSISPDHCLFVGGRLCTIKDTRALPKISRDELKFMRSNGQGKREDRQI